MNKQIKSISQVDDEKSNGKTEAAEVKKAPSIEEIQKALEEQIANFTRKNELIANRERFLLTKKQLQEYLRNQGADFNDSLDSDILRIQLSDNNRFRDEAKISISNNLIIREFLTFVICKIDQKVLELEKEIIQ